MSMRVPELITMVMRLFAIWFSVTIQNGETPFGVPILFKVSRRAR